MSSLSTHILNTSTGLPAADVRVIHSFNGAVIATALTNKEGRIADLLGGKGLEVGEHKLEFEIGAYFSDQKVEYFFPKVVIDFLIKDASRSHHVPLLISPFGFSTYRGS